MATPIQLKVAQLLGQGINLGTPLGPETDAGYGGKMQEFNDCTLYYHPVMGTEAKEVHGAIRTKYKSLGAHGLRQKATVRLFGFPLTDDTTTPLHSCHLNRFETGAIYNSYGAVAIYGEFYTEYQRRGGDGSNLGLPVSDPIALTDGTVVFFEFGCLYKGVRSQQAFLEIRYNFPLIGQPWLIKSADIGIKDVVTWRHPFILNYNLAGHLLDDIFKGRLFLKQTASTTEHPLTINPLTATATTVSPNITQVSGKLQFVGTAPTLVNRRLYDIILKFPTGTFAVGPHSVYIRETWTDFKFVHATDSHVSRRIDGFRKFFRDRGMMVAAQNMNNPNDRFREFIRWANQLWRVGNLDFIFLTGDLVDYVFEDSRKWQGHNNFVFFEDLLLGKTGTPDQVPNEELMVPIFTSLGNHDYRLMPYYPYFYVDTPGSDMLMEQYGQFNLNKDEAKVLTEEYCGVRSALSSDAAIKLTSPDRNNAAGNLRHYFSRINRDASYMVPIGPKHSLVMIDGRWDDGVIEGTWDALCYALGLRGEATDNFVGGSPDSVGFVADDFTLIRAAMARQGLCMVGVHAPAINPKWSDYAYWLREQLRGAHPTPYTLEMRRYLFRKSPASFRETWDEKEGYNLTLPKYETWSRTNTTYYNESTGGELLDYGVMRRMQADFLKYCTGSLVGTRPLDVVFSGHVHKNWESRVKYNPANSKFRFYYDFYTENPTKYYNTIHINIQAAGWFQPPVGKSIGTHMNDNKQVIRVKIDPTATNNEVPTLGASNVWSIKTKPYNNPLNAQVGAPACAAWWQDKKPLLIQTSSLGQGEWQRGDLPQPDFRGCRWISVGSDVIQKIVYVMTADITAALVAGTGNDPSGSVIR